MQITVIKPRGILRTTTEGMLQHLENCGRTCYKSEGRITPTSAGPFLRRIIKMGHESVLEHASITATIIGDRSMSHQLVRHRLMAISQESQRYCNYGKLGLQLVCPPDIGVPVGAYYFDSMCEGVFKTPENKEQITTEEVPELGLVWLINRAKEYREYLQLLQDGIKPEDARSCLPNATKTEVVVTCNIRMWRHIFRERALNPRAQWQIKEIMMSLLEELNAKEPVLFGDLYE